MSATPAPSGQAPIPNSALGQPRSRRLMSLDALRGFDMFWIVGGEEPVHGLYKLWHGGRFGLLHDQVEHKLCARPV